MKVIRIFKLGDTAAPLLEETIDPPQTIEEKNKVVEAAEDIAGDDLLEKADELAEEVIYLFAY